MERLNIVGVETPFGYRTVELRVGDALLGGVTADVLVASTFVDDLVPVPGTLVGSLKNHGVDLYEARADAEPKTELIRSLRADLDRAVNRAAEYVPEHHASLVEDLRRIVASDAMRSLEVGIIGRRLAEFLALDLAGPNFANANLFERIKSLAEVAVSPWIRGYFGVLRVLGNNAAHEQGQVAWLPPNVDEDDLVVCLFCMLRILSFWTERKDEGERLLAGGLSETAREA